MELVSDFNLYVDKGLAEMDFPKMFIEIRDNDMYNPQRLEEAVLFTIHKVISTKRSSLMEKYLPCLSMMTSILRDKEVKPYKVQLLAIVSDVAFIVEACYRQSTDNLMGLYN